jgi:hypothetical protein
LRPWEGGNRVTSAPCSSKKTIAPCSSKKQKDNQRDQGQWQCDSARLHCLQNLVMARRNIFPVYTYLCSNLKNCNNIYGHYGSSLNSNNEVQNTGLITLIYAPNDLLRSSLLELKREHVASSASLGVPNKNLAYDVPNYNIPPEEEEEKKGSMFQTTTFHPKGKKRKKKRKSRQQHERRKEQRATPRRGRGVGPRGRLQCWRACIGLPRYRGTLGPLSACAGSLPAPDPPTVYPPAAPWRHVPPAAPPHAPIA